MVSVVCLYVSSHRERRLCRGTDGFRQGGVAHLEHYQCMCALLCCNDVCLACVSCCCFMQKWRFGHVHGLLSFGFWHAAWRHYSVTHCRATDSCATLTVTHEAHVTSNTHSYHCPDHFMTMRSRPTKQCALTMICSSLVSVAYCISVCKHHSMHVQSDSGRTITQKTF